MLLFHVKHLLCFLTVSRETFLKLQSVVFHVKHSFLPLIIVSRETLKRNTIFSKEISYSVLKKKRICGIISSYYIILKNSTERRIKWQK